MPILRVTPSDWYSGLLQTARQLRTLWAHDWHGVNRLPFEIEKRSWAALTLRANGLPAPLRLHMEQLILRTDVQAVPLNHERMTDQVFVWGLPWCQIMLNEADILIGSTPELGTGLGEALAEECVKAGFSECVTVGTAAGRVRFLRQTRFSSPAALALDMPTRVHTELNTLVSQGTI